MNDYLDSSQILATACDELLGGSCERAQKILRKEAPFKSIKAKPRGSTKKQKMALWRRDQFSDRYTNKRLIFPGTLRLLSLLMPAEFPYHSAWKYEECHSLYWELYPTLDHIQPISRGGLDEESNWATTSMMRNSIKSSFTLDEVGWQLFDIQNSGWDGLTGFYLNYLEARPELKAEKGIKEWFSVAH